VTLDLETVAALLEYLGLSYVAVPEPWTGEGAVDVFEAENFIRMLEESLVEG